MPRVTVIIPAHDAAETLAGTLASVQAQTFGDWEAVVVDDGSRDGTAEIAEAAGARVRVVRHETALGPSASRNRGAREGAGELLAMLDADDRWKPGYLASQVAAHDAAVAAGRRVGAVCCDAELVTPDGGAAGLWSDRVGRVERVELSTLLRENVVFTSVLCTRVAFEDLGGYSEDPGIRISAQDYDLWLRMVERGYEIVVNPEVLALYRLGSGALSSKVAQQAASGRLVMERALQRGNLDGAQRRVARRRRRAFRVVERRARIAAEPRLGRRVLQAVTAAPLVALAALERPERWGRWLRDGPRSVGATRHTGS